MDGDGSSAALSITSSIGRFCCQVWCSQPRHIRTGNWDKNGSVPSLFHVKGAIRAVIVSVVSQAPTEEVEMLLRGIAEPKETTERA